LNNSFKKSKQKRPKFNDTTISNIGQDRGDGSQSEEEEEDEENVFSEEIYRRALEDA
jgi:hypothetical protein